MIVNAKHKLETLVSTDIERPTLAHPWLLGDRLVATDGVVLVALPVERGLFDVDGPVPVGLFELARAEQGKDPSIEILCQAGRAVLPSGITFPRPALPPFPDWQAVARVVPDTFLAVNPDHLFRVAKALGWNRQWEPIVRLGMAGDEAPITVESPTMPDGTLALVMPARWSGAAQTLKATGAAGTSIPGQEETRPDAPDLGDSLGGFAKAGA